VVKVLVDGVSILKVDKDGASYIRDGYIYVENGIVRSVGQGPAPEEYLYPEFLVSGHGRLATKGFASGFTVLSLYPVRYEVDDVDWFVAREMLKYIKRSDMYYVAVLSLAELVSKGVTEALVVDSYLDEVARASRDVGIDVTLAPPLNCGLDEQQQLHELKLLLGRWHGKVEGVKVGVAVCGEPEDRYLNLAREAGLPLYAIEIEKHLPALPKDVKVVAINPLVDVDLPRVYYGRMLKEWRGGAGLGIGVRPSYSMRDVLKEVLWFLNSDPIDMVLAGTKVTSDLIDHPESSALREGSRSSLVVYNLSEPPGWPVPREPRSAARAVIGGDLPIETVMIGDEVVLDREGLLTVGYEVFRKATKKFEDLLPTLPPSPSR
jgi:cytosine/adenosine deaminase-related metal-dependent hydrolase